MSTPPVSSKVVLDGFKAIVEGGAEKFCSEYETPKNPTESKTEYSYTYGCLSVAAFTCSAIFSRHLNFYKNYIMVAFFIAGAMSLYLTKQVKQVPTQECVDIRDRFKQFCDPLIEALEQAKMDKIAALHRAIRGPSENPTKYVSDIELEGQARKYINGYDTGGENTSSHFSWNVDPVKAQVLNYRDALEWVERYLASGFQEKISKELDPEVQKGVAKLKGAATCFVHGYDKPEKETPANAKLYVNAKWNGTAASVEAWE